MGISRILILESILWVFKVSKLALLQRFRFKEANEFFLEDYLSLFTFKVSLHFNFSYYSKVICLKNLFFFFYFSFSFVSFSEIFANIKNRLNISLRKSTHNHTRDEISKLVVRRKEAFVNLPSTKNLFLVYDFMAISL